MDIKDVSVRTFDVTGEATIDRIVARNGTTIEITDGRTAYSFRIDISLDTNSQLWLHRLNLIAEDTYGFKIGKNRDQGWSNYNRQTPVGESLERVTSFNQLRRMAVPIGSNIHETDTYFKTKRTTAFLDEIFGKEGGSKVMARFYSNFSVHEHFGNSYDLIGTYEPVLKEVCKAVMAELHK
jgi:hypothetical protein